MRAEYREEPCRSALNRVRGMPFAWSLNPYMGCAHRCTFCYVRAFEARADRPSDERYGASIRVKTNVAEVLRRELARASWQRETVAVGAATDPYQPAEGRYRLTRACVEAFAEAPSPFSIITRGPLIVRDVDVLVEAARSARVSVTFSVPTLDHEIWSRTEPGTAPPHQRLRALSRLVDAGIDAGVGMAPILPGLSDRPELLAEVVAEARGAGAAGVWANGVYLRRAPHIRVIGEAADGESAVALAERRRPNVVIMDVRMPGMDGLEATKELMDRVPDSAVLIFTAYSERSLLSRGLESGAKGYVLKEAPHETLLRAIEKVAGGEGYVDPALMPAFLTGRDKDDMLTTREREILQLLADGMSNADVATQLFISQETVKSHVRHLLAKLEADTRTHAVAIAFRDAIID